jgi:hypothetical protein
MSDTAITVDKELIKHFLALVSLHNNIPKEKEEGYVPVSFVEQYNEHIKYFASKFDDDLSEFKLPASAMSDNKPNRLPGWCEKPMFLSQLSSLINYIDQIYMPKEDARKIGFHLD